MVLGMLLLINVTAVNSNLIKMKEAFMHSTSLSAVARNFHSFRID